MNAPDLRPNQPDSAAAPMETSQDHQLTHLIDPMAKVLPAGGPLLSRDVCPSCGHAHGEPRDNPFRSCATCGYRAP